MHISSSYANYWGKQIFTHGRFPKVGQKQKTEKRKKKERLKDGNNNGQLHIATPPREAHTKLPGPTNYLVTWTAQARKGRLPAYLAIHAPERAGAVGYAVCTR